MCSLKQSENPYFVHIDHFSDLDEEFDELDDLDAGCPACGCEAVDCACEGSDSDGSDACGIEADTSLTPFTPLSYIVKGSVYPFAKVAEGLGRGVSGIAGNSDVQSAQERDANVGNKEDMRVARMVLDLNREGAGVKKFLSLGKNKKDETSVRQGGKGGDLSWFGYSWAFTKYDIDDFMHDFKIINMKTEVTINNVKQDKLMLQLAHKMFSTSIWKRTLAVRKLTYREAMNDLYKIRSRFDTEHRRILDRWWKRDHQSEHVTDANAKNKKAEHHEVRKYAKMFKKQDFEDEIHERRKNIYDQNDPAKKKKSFFQFGSHNPPVPPTRQAIPSQAHHSVLDQFAHPFGHAQSHAAYREVRVPHNGGYIKRFVPSNLLSHHRAASAAASYTVEL